MITDWAIYYQQNKHLPLNKIMENYNKLILEYNDRITLVNQQTPLSGGPAGNASTTIDLIYSSIIISWTIIF